ncbi:MAG TPA: flagellar biosynthesis protein FlhF [Chitinivibrionales bacterium]
MKIKKYTAKNMTDALLQIKEDLGEEAIILKTSKIPRKLFPLGNGDAIEVTAAIDDQAPTRRMPAFAPLAQANTMTYKRPKPSGRTNGIAGASVTDDQTVKLASAPELKKAAAPEHKLSVMDIKEEIRELKDLLSPTPGVDQSIEAGGYSEPWVHLYGKLLSAEVRDDLARGLIDRIKGNGTSSTSEADKRFKEALQSSFPVSGPLKLKENKPLICVFVGPTGAGKTTTLAKLAAHYRLNKNKSVGIITADTYRIAAIEQIKTFVDIMSISLQVVFSPDEIAQALTACAGNDIVFVDTAGRSRKNTEHMRDLRQFLDALHPDETHLVLSAGTKDADLQDTIDQYRSMDINRVLFTKFDETGKLGNVYNTVVGSAIPVSYFTFGQGVPDDIELAQPVRFLHRLWKEAAL